MRRKEKEISKLAELETIISKAKVCHLALSVDNQPYVVPLCFGYKSKTMYFHSASEGKKLDMIRANPQVCFELFVNDTIVKADKACNWGMKFKSVIGFGKAQILESDEDKIKALDIIMNQYANQSWEYKPKMLDQTTLIKVEIEELTGKQTAD